MTIREKQEQQEHVYLSPVASFSDSTLGRDFPEKPCDIRTEYQRDRDRILHSKAFRRLKGKTQVFLIPEGDHYRTRMTHTLLVSQIARTMAKALRLNDDLTEAIALGHDLGHTPFGHAGERALDRISPFGFKHSEQSVRCVELLEKRGDKIGLNLTKEVRDGMLNHQTSSNPMTLEGKLVRLSDKIAYINHDIDDAIRGGIITEEQIPHELTDVLGHNLSERLDTLIHDIVMNSEGESDIIMTPEIHDTMQSLRSYLFESVYTNPKAKGEESKAEKMLEDLFNYYCDHMEALPEEYVQMYRTGGEERERVVCDYIAGMTDHYAVTKYSEINIPTAWTVF